MKKVRPITRMLAMIVVGIASLFGLSIHTYADATSPYLEYGEQRYWFENAWAGTPWARNHTNVNGEGAKIEMMPKVGGYHWKVTFNGGALEAAKRGDNPNSDEPDSNFRYNNPRYAIGIPKGLELPKEMTFTVYDNKGQVVKNTKDNTDTTIIKNTNKPSNESGGFVDNLEDTTIDDNSWLDDQRLIDKAYEDTALGESVTEYAKWFFKGDGDATIDLLSSGDDRPLSPKPMDDAAPSNIQAIYTFRGADEGNRLGAWGYAATYVIEFDTDLKYDRNSGFSDSKIELLAAMRNRESDPGMNIYIKSSKYTLYNSVWYCYNYDLAVMPTGSKFAEENYDNSWVPKPEFNDGDKTTIKWLMLLGYPFDVQYGAKNTSFMQEYINQFKNDPAYVLYNDLDIYQYAARQFYFDTQKAIWHFTNGRLVNSSWEPKIQKIIDVAKQLTKDKVPFPDNVDALYLDNADNKLNGKTVQNFVSLRANEVLKNTPSLNLKLKKVDGNQKAITNNPATFDIYEGAIRTNLAEDKKVKKDITTKQDGFSEVISDLKADTPYTIIERQSPNGYSAGSPVVFRLASVYTSDRYAFTYSNNFEAVYLRPYLKPIADEFRLEVQRKVPNQTGVYEWIPVETIVNDQLSLKETFKQADVPLYIIDNFKSQAVSLGDFAWYDHNHNGLQDEGEAPVANVKATLYRFGEPAKVKDVQMDRQAVTVSQPSAQAKELTDPEAIVSTMTDEKGHYYFKNLKSGEYAVKFELADGYAFTYQNKGDNQLDSDVNVLTGLSEPGNVFKDDKVREKNNPYQLDNPDFDAGLVQPVSLGDYAWVDENKNGIQEDNEKPLANVKAYLQVKDGSTYRDARYYEVVASNGLGINDEKALKVLNYQGTQVQVDDAGYIYTTTDAQGHYAFRNILPGHYQVKFELPSSVYKFTKDSTEVSNQKSKDSDALLKNVDKNHPQISTTKEYFIDNRVAVKDDPNNTLSLTDPTIDVGVYEEAASFGDFVWFDGNYFSSDAYGKKRTDPNGREVIVGGSKFDLTSEAAIRASRKGTTAEEMQDMTFDDRGISYVKVELLNEDGTPAKVKDVAFDGKQIYTNMNLKVAEGKETIKAAKGTIGDGDLLKQNFMDGKIYHWYDGWTSNRYEGDNIPDYDSEQKAFKLSADGDQLAYTYTTDLGAEYLDNSIYAWTAEKDNRELYGRYFFKGLKPGKYRARFTIYKKEGDWLISPFNKFLNETLKVPPVQFNYTDRSRIRPVVKAEEGEITSDSEFNRGYTPDTTDQAYKADSVVTDVFDLGNVTKNYKAFTNKKNPTDSDFTLSLTNPSIDVGFVASSDVKKQVSLGNRIWIDQNQNGLQDDNELDSWKEVSEEKGFSEVITELYAKSKNELLQNFANQYTTKAAATYQDDIDDYRSLGKTMVSKEGYYRFENLASDNIYRVRFVLPQDISNQYEFTKANVEKTATNRELSKAYEVIKPVLDKVVADKESGLTAQDLQNSQKFGQFLVDFFARDLRYMKYVGNGKVATDDDRKARSAEIADYAKKFFAVLVPDAINDNAKDSDVDGFGYTDSYIVTDEARPDDKDVKDNDQTPKPTAPNFDAGLVKSSVSLGNIVWYDEGEGSNRGNGQLDKGEKPAVGIQAILYKDGAPAKLADVLGNGKLTDFQDKEIKANDKGELITLTDENGKYAFKGLKPGKYQVKFVNTLEQDVKDNLRFTIHRQVSYPEKDLSIAENNQSSPTYGLTDELQVSPVADELKVDGLDNPQFDAGFVRPVSLGNRVWLDQNANGKQDDNEKSADIFSKLKADGVTVSVQAIKAKTSDEKVPFITKKVQVGEDGTYSFTDLLPGDYRVTFTLEGNEKGKYQFTKANQPDVDDKLDSDAVVGENPNVATTESLSVREVLNGDVDNPNHLTNPSFDAGVKEIIETVSLGNQVWYDEGAAAGHLANGIFDVDEQPVEDVTVTLYVEKDGKKVEAKYQDVVANREEGIQDATGKLTLANDATVSTKTNNQGKYAFKGLKPGKYAVKFTDLPKDYSFTTIYSDKSKDDGSDADKDGFTELEEVQVATDEEKANYPNGDNLDNPRLDAGIIRRVSLGNEVWFDENENGLKDEGESFDSLKDKIIVKAVLSKEGNKDFKLEKPVTDGKYQFTDLVPGNYKVTFIIDGKDKEKYQFTTQTEKTSQDKDSDANPTNGETVYDSVIYQADKVDGLDNPKFDAGIIERTNQPVSLGDYVWLDEGKDTHYYNGIQDADEKGVAGVTVSLVKKVGDKYEVLTAKEVAFDSKTKVMTSGNQEIAADKPVQVQTDKDGHYEFSGLKPGEYMVQFSLSEALAEQYVFTKANQGADDAKDSDALVANAKDAKAHTSAYTVNHVKVDANGKKTDGTDLDYPRIDAGIVHKVSFGDYVWYDNGNGIQDDGEKGAKDITVTLKDKSGKKTIATDKTDEDGRYQFTDLVPGEYQVEFSKPEDYEFTTPNKGDESKDSNVDDEGHTTVTVRYNPYKKDGELDNPTIDAGLIEKNKPVTIGDFIWIDDNADGIQNDKTALDETVKVQLYVNGEKANYDDVVFNKETGITTTAEPIKASGEVITTVVNGKYEFAGLQPNQAYSVKFILQDDTKYKFTLSNVGGDTKESDTQDSDADVNGLTAAHTVESGKDMTFDAGLINKNIYSLGDYVWKDSNLDDTQLDVKKRLEAPMVGVTVTLLKDGQPAKAAEVAFYPSQGVVAKNQDKLFKGDDIVSMTTGKDGYYYFAGLKKGNYQVEFSLPKGYQFVAGEQGDLTQDSNVVNKEETKGTTAVFALDRHSEFTANNPYSLDDPTVDAGYQKLVSLGDYVWYDDNGNGIQDAGEKGVADVKVYLLDENGERIPDKEPQTTDENGKYRFDELKPGNYGVEFTEIPADYKFTLKDVGKDTEDSDAGVDGKTAILKVDKENLTFDAGIVPRNVYSLGDYVWKDTNFNGKQDAEEEVVTGLVVTLLDQEGNEISAAKAGFDNKQVFTNQAPAGIQADSITTTTDENGHYYFAGLKAGKYKVKFAALDEYQFTKQKAANVDDAYNSDADENGMTDVIELNRGNLQENNPFNLDNPTIDAGYYRPLTLGDRIWFDKNKNGIQDADETNFPAKLTVTVELLKDNQVLATTTADEKGYYSFKDLEPADGYRVRFTLSGDVAGKYRFTKHSAEVDYTGEQKHEVDSDVKVTDNQSVAQTEVFSLSKLTVNGENPLDLDNPTIDAGIIELDDDTPNQPDNPNNPDNPDNPDNPNNPDNPDQPTGQKVSLGDFVWYDDNENGLQDADETGVAGVKVHLINAKDEEIGHTTTGADGKYRFDNLEENQRYYVKFEAPTGYTFTKTDVADNTKEAEDSDADAEGNTKPQVVKYNSEKGNLPDNPDFDAGIRLIVPKNGQLVSLGDYTFIDKDLDNHQSVGDLVLPGVKVLLKRVVQRDGKEIELQPKYKQGAEFVVGPLETVTDNTGHYAFTDLVPGDYRVYFGVDKVNYRFVQQGDGTHEADDSDADSEGKTKVKTVQNRDISNDLNNPLGLTNPFIDAGIQFIRPIIVPPQSVSLGDYVWLDSNQNGLQDIGESGIANVIVRLYDATGNAVIDPQTNLPAITRTNSQGRYGFTGLNPGEYKVKVDIPKGFVATIQKANNGEKPALDSNIDKNGWMDKDLVELGELVDGLNNPHFDAGLIKEATITPPTDGGTDEPEKVYGSFQDHNFYYVIDSDGTPYKVDTYSTDIQVGTSEEFYTTAGTLKEGYRFVRTENPINNPTYLTTGEKTKGAFKPNVKQEITYVYERPLVSLGDYVFVDMDRDGVQSTGDLPLAGVGVKVVTENGDNPTVFDPTTKKFVQKKYTTYTDNQGKYHFDHLVEGRYRVIFTLTEKQEAIYQFTKQSVGNNDAIDSDANALGETPAKMVTAGEKVDGLNNPHFDAGVLMKAQPTPNDPEDDQPDKDKTHSGQTTEKLIIQRTNNPKKKLPKAGSASNSTWIALGIFVVGLTITGIQLYQRRKD